MITQSQVDEILAKYAGGNELGQDMNILAQFIHQQSEAVDRAEMGAAWIRDAVNDVQISAGDDWTKRILRRLLDTMPTGSDMLERFRLVNLQHQRYASALDSAYIALDLTIGRFQELAQTDRQAAETLRFIRNAQYRIKSVQIFEEVEEPS